MISDSSEVTQNKTKADASALAAGQKVEIEFVMDGAKKVARRSKSAARPPPSSSTTTNQRYKKRAGDIASSARFVLLA